MKNQNGFAPLIVILALVLVGGGTYAVVNRAVLKSYFEKGDKPTENQGVNASTSEEISVTGDKPTASQFSAVIDSSLDISVGNKDEESSHNLLPEDKQVFTSEEALKPITFRWTPLVPKPRDPVTYRLKVWQLMQGQNGTQSMRSNQPIVEKDVVDMTEVSVSGLYTGPCKPPYLCDFVWEVQVAGNEKSTSEPTTFSVSDSEASASDASKYGAVSGLHR